MDKIKNGVHISTEEQNYYIPKERNILDKLSEFQDRKLGFMMHFGVFTQFGMVESWALSDEHASDRWSQEGVDWHDDMEEFKAQYWESNKSFNPTRFDPQRFADVIKGFGFKYVLIPTKHHDGFCLWDTKYSEYKSTNDDCPYHTNKNADIFGSLIKEFQKDDLMIGAYFSKPDWNCDDYWPEDFKTSGQIDRNVGYDIAEFPEKWDRFRQYTENQMIEIVSNYDKIDIMWLDGGQVKKGNNQDIKIDDITNKMREVNPDLIVCDRTCGGFSENYITPEQTIPDHYIGIPWESCITLGGPFSYSYRDQYKSPKEVAEIFVEIICKGGNLALNVAPQPDGRLPANALTILTDFSDWVDEHKDAIFNTRATYPYYNGNCGVVKDKLGQHHLFVNNKKGRLTTPKYVYINIDLNIKKAFYKDEEVIVTKIGEKYRFEMPRKYIDRKESLVNVFRLVI